MKLEDRHGDGEEPAKSKKGILLILLALVLTGLAAGYSWWRDLPR